ncbi:MAG: vanadium-dependent haloperoxidase, partial [Planctomycetota bacterium]
YDSLSQYTPTFEPGRWQPDPLNPTQEAWGPAWGSVTPFALETNTQFMPPPSPDLTSEEYADAFDEVLQLGSVDSTERTADQTQIGLFWAYDREGLGTPMRLYNNIMREIADQEGNSMHENAEMFALASVAMADAGIVAWNAKFEYDLWRPVTGIRQADEDGNGLTMADPDWTPLGAPGGAGTDFTPPFPTYISGHATFGGAMFAALAEFFGDDNIAFTIGSEELPGVERSFTSLSEAMAENGRSRVYLGIHWNYDDTVGQETGAQIAQYISSGLFRASAPEPATAALLAAVAPVVLAARRRCA